MSGAIILPRGIDSDIFFERMPNNVRRYFSGAFSILAELPESTLSEIASQVSRWLDPAEPEPDVPTLANTFDVSEREVTAIIAATTLVASACFAVSRPMSIKTFVSTTTSFQVLRDVDAPAIKSLVDVLRSPHGPALSDALRRANSSTRILPSFEQFTTAIDLRVVSISDERIVTVPMVMAKLRTDGRNQDFLFQMTPRDIGVLIQQLQKLSEQLSRTKKARIQLSS